MESRFRSLDLQEPTEPMDVDSPFIINRDNDGDVSMDESISTSPSLPLRYHNYFHRINKVQQVRPAQKITTLQEMKNRIDEIDNSLKTLDSQEKEILLEPSFVSQADKIVQPSEAADVSGMESDEDKENKNYNNKSLIRSIMSPTVLGAKVAYNSSPLSSPAKSFEEEEEILEYSTADAVVENPNGALVARQVPQVAQFQVHHHHYYYPVNQGTSSGLTAPSIPISNDTAAVATLPPQQQQQQIQRFTQDGDIFLPAPSNFRDTTYYISTYLQTLFNFVISSYALYILYQLVSGMKNDIDLKLKEKIQDLIIEVSICRDHFEENKCFKDTIVPAIRDQCGEWEKCMYKDPFSTSGKAVITAQLIGMIVNALLDPISLRNVLALAILVFFAFALNFSFGFLRAKIYFRDQGKKDL